MWVCMPGNRFVIYFVLSHGWGEDHIGLQVAEAALKLVNDVCVCVCVYNSWITPDENKSGYWLT